MSSELTFGDIYRKINTFCKEEAGVDGWVTKHKCVTLDCSFYVANIYFRLIFENLNVNIKSCAKLLKRTIVCMCMLSLKQVKREKDIVINIQG